MPDLVTSLPVHNCGLDPDDVPRYNGCSIAKKPIILRLMFEFRASLIYTGLTHLPGPVNDLGPLQTNMSIALHRL